MALEQREIIQILTEWRSVTEPKDTLNCMVQCSSSAILHTSRESRETAMMQHFKPLLRQPEEVDRTPQPRVPTKNITFSGFTRKILDLDQDYLFIGCDGIEYLPQIIAHLDIRNAKRVCIGVDFAEAQTMRLACLWVRKACPKLEEFRLAFGGIHPWKGVSSEHLRFAKADSNLGDLVDSWVQTIPRGRTRRRLTLWSQSLIQSAGLIKKYTTPITSRPDWSNVDCEVCVVARRDMELGSWKFQWEGGEVRGKTISVEQTFWYKDFPSMISRYDGIKTLFEEENVTHSAI
jgi:hypothetical protein